ncbi:hypothetical protein AB0N05_37860 [Nocardia sp. NPDC051030]|uniref:hypothetical protein n=1 Tax=Nocardia sp. NPDC051030 TaxID=3155162 RepID=UPI0034362CC1
MSESTYAVDIQSYIGGDFAKPHFTVLVRANDLAQAERRAIRRALENASAFNASHPYSFPRQTYPAAYRAIRAQRLSEFPTGQGTKVPTDQGTVKVIVAIAAIRAA